MAQGGMEDREGGLEVTLGGCMLFWKVSARAG
jgi:hypothetical protein